MAENKKTEATAKAQDKKNKKPSFLDKVKFLVEILALSRKIVAAVEHIRYLCIGSKSFTRSGRNHIAA